MPILIKYVEKYDFSGSFSFCLSYYMAKMEVFRGLPGVVKQFGESSLVTIYVHIDLLIVYKGSTVSGE